MAQRVSAANAKRKKHNKSLFLRIALLCFAVYMVYSMISLQAQLAQKKQELQKELDAINEQKMSIDEINQLLKSGSKDELIERAARDKLDFVFKNEEVYEDISGK